MKKKKGLRTLGTRMALVATLILLVNIILNHFGIIPVTLFRIIAILGIVVVIYALTLIWRKKKK